jgi:hypothetical protein
MGRGRNSEETVMHASDRRQVVSARILPPPERRQGAVAKAVLKRIFFFHEG